MTKSWEITIESNIIALSLSLGLMLERDEYILVTSLINLKRI